MLEKAVGYVDKNATHNRLGGKSLIALALLKGGRPADHPKVKEAVEACRDAVRQLEQQHSDDVMYDLSIAIIFLSELDPEQYRSEIQALVKLMVKWQKPFGGWGYLMGTHLRTGDTSMTQYGVLALWMADRTGAAPVPVDSAVRVANWLLRTQDPSGGWGYQGEDPGGFNRVAQTPVTHSLSAAGAGSIYVLGDLLRLNEGLRKSGPAPAVRVVAKKGTQPSLGPLTGDVDRGRLRQAMADGDGWFDKNFSIETSQQLMYYLYALERYKSFRELALAKEEVQPQWYDEGVSYLMKTQQANGSWATDNGPDVDTCFGILFLARGTKKTIAKAEAYNGRLRGGRGLPGTTADVTVGADGQIVQSAFRGQADSLLSILESSSSSDLEEAGRDYQITLSDDPQQRQQQLLRFRRLVGADEFGVRMAALRALVSTRDLDNVPTLIYALGDPDPRIVHLAHQGLRSLSRRLDVEPLPEEPSEGAKLEAIERWKQWFLTVRPDAQFLN